MEHPFNTLQGLVDHGQRPVALLRVAGRPHLAEGLDEPAAGLDLAGREALVAQLSELARDEDAPALVLVTHHLEEVPPGFTHALLLRDGHAVAAGPIEQTLTEGHLSAAFDTPLRVTRTGGRYTAVAQ